MGVRVLYSFPLKIGAGGICSTAWHQVEGVAAAGADVIVMAGVQHRPFGKNVVVRTTLARAHCRVPYRLIGLARALALHDRIVAHALPELVGQVDVVHAWPLAAIETLDTAKRLGIPTVLERPNAHTRFAMQVVAEESHRLGVDLPARNSHAFNERKLVKEEREYQLATQLLCPSQFVEKTFLDRGFEAERLSRHMYGYDSAVFYPELTGHDGESGLTAVFVGECAVRKGVHFALEAWLRSSASRTGKFRIAGDFLPAYERKLATMLRHPSVEALGHRNDVAKLMRESDILLLPSIEEGSPLACVEAIGSGCVPLVSNVCTDPCVHGFNSLVHRAGDVDSLTEHINSLHFDRDQLAELRQGCIRDATALTWSVAGRRLRDVYEQVMDPSRSAAGAAQAVS